MGKYLVALPTVKGQTGYNCPTILVSASSFIEAIEKAKSLRPGKNIGSVKKVDY